MPEFDDDERRKGKHHITAPRSYKRWSSPENKEDAPVAKVIARQSLTQRQIRQQSEGLGEDQTTELINLLFTDLQKKMSDNNSPREDRSFYFSQKDGKDGDYVNVAYDHFIINRIRLQKRDKTQIVQSFDDDFLYSFGSAPEQAQFSGFLINSRNHKWRTGWLHAYDELLSADSSLSEFVDTVVVFEDQIWKGRILNTSFNEQAQNPVAAQFSFNFYLEEDRSPKDDLVYQPPLKDLKEKQLPPSARFQQTSRQQEPKQEDGPKEDRIKSDADKCKNTIKDQLPDSPDKCQPIVDAAKNALGNDDCKNLSDASQEVRNALREWVKEPLNKARSAIQQTLTGESSLNKVALDQEFSQKFKPFFRQKAQKLRDFLNELKQSQSPSSSLVQEASKFLFGDKYELYFSNEVSSSGEIVGQPFAKDKWGGLQTKHDTPAITEDELGDLSWFSDDPISNEWVSDAWFEDNLPNLTPQNLISLIGRDPIGGTEIDTGFFKDDSYTTIAEAIARDIDAIRSGELEYSWWISANAETQHYTTPSDLKDRITVLKQSVENRDWRDQGVDQTASEIWDSNDEKLLPSGGGDAADRIALALERYISFFDKADDFETVQNEWLNVLEEQVSARADLLDPDKPGSIFKQINSDRQDAPQSIAGTSVSIIEFILNYAQQTRHPTMDYHNELSVNENVFIVPSQGPLSDGSSLLEQFTPDGLIRAGGNKIHPLNTPSNAKIAKILGAIGTSTYAGDIRGEHSPTSGISKLFPDLTTSANNDLSHFSAGKLKIQYGQATSNIKLESSDLFNENKKDDVENRVIKESFSANLIINESSMDETMQTVAQKYELARKRWLKLSECLNIAKQGDSELKQEWFPRGDGGPLDQTIIPEAITQRNGVNS